MKNKFGIEEMKKKLKGHFDGYVIELATKHMTEYNTGDYTKVKYTCSEIAKLKLK